MDRRWILAGGGLLLLGIAGVAVVIAEPSKGPVFIAGGQPVSEDQVRQKLQSDGWSNVQIVRDGRYFEAMGSKDGQQRKSLSMRRPAACEPRMMTTMIE